MLFNEYFNKQWFVPPVKDEIEIASLNSAPSARPSDEAVCLLVKAFEQSPWNGVYNDQTGKERLQKLFNAPNFLGVLAFDRVEKNLVGMALGAFNLLPNKKIGFLLEEVCVSSEYQRAGVGRKIVETILNDAKAWGAISARLGTHRKAPAVKLYASMGFREFKPSWHYDYPNRQAMRLNLQTTSISPKA